MANYVLKQFNKVPTDGLDNRFMTRLTPEDGYLGKATRRSSLFDANVTGESVMQPFCDECLRFENGGLKTGAHYYFHGKIKRMSTDQTFTVKLVNSYSSEEGTEDMSQYIKTLVVQKGDDGEDFGTISDRYIQEVNTLLKEYGLYTENPDERVIINFALKCVNAFREVTADNLSDYINESRGSIVMDFNSLDRSFQELIDGVPFQALPETARNYIIEYHDFLKNTYEQVITDLQLLTEDITLNYQDVESYASLRKIYSSDEKFQEVLEQKLSEYSTLNQKKVKEENWVDFAFIFTPMIDYDTILFELNRTSYDFREMTRCATIIYMELSEINNWLDFTADVQKGTELLKIGVQSHPGLEMCINGEEISIGRSGIYELKNGIITTTFFSVVSAQAGNEEFLNQKKVELFDKYVEIIHNIKQETDSQKRLELENAFTNDLDASISFSFLDNTKPDWNKYFESNASRSIDPFTLDYMYDSSIKR